jgi:hypothetical protein
MASKKDDKREDAKREIDTPPFTGKITLERNEHGVLVAMVEGIVLEGVVGLSYVTSPNQLSLTLYLDPSAVIFATSGGEQKTIH